MEKLNVYSESGDFGTPPAGIPNFWTLWLGDYFKLKTKIKNAKNSYFGALPCLNLTLRSHDLLHGDSPHHVLSENSNFSPLFIV